MGREYLKLKKVKSFSYKNLEESINANWGLIKFNKESIFHFEAANKVDKGWMFGWGIAMRFDNICGPINSL